MPPEGKPKLNPATVATHNWEQRAKQLFAIAETMGDTPAAAVLRDKAEAYLRQAKAGNLHAKRS